MPLLSIQSNNTEADTMTCGMQTLDKDAITPCGNIKTHRLGERDSRAVIVSSTGEKQHLSYDQFFESICRQGIKNSETQLEKENSEMPSPVVPLMPKNLNAHSIKMKIKNYRTLIKFAPRYTGYRQLNYCMPKVYNTVMQTTLGMADFISNQDTYYDSENCISPIQNHNAWGTRSRKCKISIADFCRYAIFIALSCIVCDWLGFVYFGIDGMETFHYGVIEEIQKFFVYEEKPLTRMELIVKCISNVF